MIPVNAFESVEIEIEGAKLFEIHVNGINHTFTFLGNNNKLNIPKEEGTPNNVTAFFVPTPDIQFATFGRSLEGNFTNTLTKDQQEIFYNLLEFYEPDSKVLDQVVEDIKTDKQRIYELIGKLNTTGFYLPTDSGLQNGSGVFKDKYLNSTSIEEFYTNLEQIVRNSLPIGG